MIHLRCVMQTAARALIKISAYPARHLIQHAVSVEMTKFQQQQWQPFNSGKLQCHVDPAQHSTAQHSTAQHSTAQHSTAQHSTAQHSTSKQSSAQHSTARHGTVR